MTDHLHYTLLNRSSNGTPIVLLHGFLESSTMWDELKLPTDRPVLTVDLPGHGASKLQVHSADSMQEMAKAVIEVIDLNGLKEYDVIGHSMGGYVALAMKQQDARLKRILLLNSNYWTDSSQKVKDRKRVAEIVQTNQSHFIYEVIPNLFLNPEKHDINVKQLISEAMQMSPEAIAKASIAMSQRTDFTDFILQFAEEITCIQGESDPIVPAKRMRKELKGSNVNYIEIAGVGHMAHIEATAELQNYLSEFLMR